MHTKRLESISLLAIALTTLPHAAAFPRVVRSDNATAACRYLPGDAQWPSVDEWNKLNDTLGGKLIQGVPLAQSCYGPEHDAAECSAVENEWIQVDPYFADPVNVMSPYWLNNTCSPYTPYASADGSGSCTLGNIASYAINVTDAASVVAGINFSQEKNIRLSIKNTGHDILGRSAGEGSVALWTHNLKEISFINYTSKAYTGPAAHVGAGVQVRDLYEAGKEAGLRSVGGSCPTVGAAGGWYPAGGHGPLTAAYGLGSDNILEVELVTADGQHITASADNEYSDLHWALSGGGAGNLGVALSMTVKAYPDGPVAGAQFTFARTDTESYWSAVKAWFKQLLTLNEIHGLKTVGEFTQDFFTLNFASLPGASVEDVSKALAPYFSELDALNISISNNATTVHPTFLEHYDFYTTAPYTNNDSVAGRIIPTSLVADDNSLTQLMTVVRSQAEQGGAFNAIANNVSYARVGNSPGSNAVLPAWRDSLFTFAFGLGLDPAASWETINDHQVTINQWQDQLRQLTPGGGAYINEATYDSPYWKEDYYGSNYDKLLSIKQKYDPDHVFWANTAVGSDTYWAPDADRRLCRVQ